MCSSGQRNRPSRPCGTCRRWTATGSSPIGSRSTPWRTKGTRSTGMRSRSCSQESIGRWTSSAGRRSSRISRKRSTAWKTWPTSSSPSSSSTRSHPLPAVAVASLALPQVPDLLEAERDRPEQRHAEHRVVHPPELAGGEQGEQEADKAEDEEEERTPAGPHHNALTGWYTSHATTNAPGIVRTQAHTTRPAIPHRTAPKRWVVPTPTIAPVMVWVVETGIPAWAVKNRVKAAASSALIPETGLSLVIREPMVWTIRHPPNSVPKPMAVCADSTTHSGTDAVFATTPFAISRARITPIVFCASFAPWPRLNAAAETNCARRNPRFNRWTFL